MIRELGGTVAAQEDQLLLSFLDKHLAILNYTQNIRFW
jgi:hypothetical protein